MNTLELIRSRRSVRTFDGRALSEEDREKILIYARKTENPYDIPMEWYMLSQERHHLSTPVIVGADTYIAGKISRIPHAEEAFGYTFEKVVLYAQSMGIGSTWIAGTMDRGAFERAVSLKDGEVMPCISPLGYPAAKMSLRETMMRKGIKADKRLPFEQLFFKGTFATPIAEADAGDYHDLLEMVRWSPSAVNKQPWRIVIDGRNVHFFEKKSGGYDENGWDLQKIDMGIALSHFILGLEEKQRTAEFVIEPPQIALPQDTVYTATLILSE